MSDLENSSRNAFRFRASLVDDAIVLLRSSPGSKGLTGYSTEEFDKNPMLWQGLVFPADLEMVLRMAELASGRKNAASFKHRIIKKTGEIIWVRITFIPDFAAGQAEKEFEWLVQSIADSEVGSLAKTDTADFSLNKMAEIEDVTFEDLFSLDEIQRLQDEFAKATGVATIITRPDGTPITRPGNFTRLCNEIIRKTPIGCANCYKSDAEIGRLCLDGPIIRTCLSGGLWDAGAGITVGGRHIANWLIGQVRNELQTEENLRAYAREIGADEDTAVAAFYEVPSMSIERFGDIARMLFTLANQISTLAYQNLQQKLFIAERQKIEQALRASEERLELAMSAANDGLWDWNLSTGEMFFDSRYYSMAGYEPDEFAHLYDEWKQRIHPDDLEAFMTAMNDHVSGKSGSFDSVYRFLRKDETWMWIHGRGKCVRRDETGSMLRIVGTQTDITDKKHAVEEREKLQAQLHQSQKMESIGRLAGGVAHDFNNMLGAIIGFAELSLYEVKPDQKLYSYIHEIKKAAVRSAELTRQLLAFARKQSVAPKVLALNETIEGMLKMLQRMIGEDIKLLWHPEQDVGMVKIDPSQIDQILANLCVNARDAIDNTGIVTIETANASFDEAYCQLHSGFVPGEYVMLAVSDDGEGMDQETLARIFEPFFPPRPVARELVWVWQPYMVLPGRITVL